MEESIVVGLAIKAILSDRHLACVPHAGITGKLIRLTTGLGLASEHSVLASAGNPR